MMPSASKSKQDIQSKVISFEEAVRNIPNGANITIGGLISVLCPEKVMAELENRFISTGEPRDLTVITPVRVGWSRNESTGLEHVANRGMLKRLISGSFNVKEGPRLTQMIRDNDIEAYGFSMGTIFHWIRGMAAGESGLITKVGLHTYVDPRYDGGRLNAKTTDNVSKVIEIDGEEHLFYPSIPIHAAIIRGSIADESGNITLENEPVTLSGLEMAMAAKASGGYVIAQVKQVVANNTLHPRDVAIPGMLVDAVVIDPDQKQSLLEADEPSWTGQVKLPLEQVYKPLPLNSKKVVLRRAAKELQDGDVINLGVGIPVGLPQLAIEEGFFDKVTFSLEHGAVGGIPMGEEVFGAHINPSSIISSPQVFDFYHCGGLSASLLGFAQIDSSGNVNVSMFNGVFRGSGGFIDITHKTKKIMFCGTLTSGGLDLSIENGKMKIIQEGKHKKFIPKVEQLTFNAQMALKNKQEVLYLTERAVFRLEEQGLTLIEYAPGMDIDRDILAYIDFKVNISPDLKEMEADLFKE
ncbi:acyl CoA:acetate/3-ketoacid CoA transferase [Aneurinibacillus sp. Ricciae_BoGa-3]|uniref:acyl CoA:acetate/3-ketoacid CoA transferase n=1 Tax=Aneurinibacillus sp. Ricciae_BoGa-3 TaxID=3022697 RepID=UPI00233F84D5|nr:CoA-transferase [Aneurinibacillus sp. Ricciae_BoGa-3]WCK56415.1 acyl CoA:acetate/3-ketoacid CoA transferase [Aneurinibacillus sp. Ricciae_BoGa-3]